MKMLYYTREWVKRFYGPDSGGTGSGTGPASDQQQQQANDPFAGIDTSEMDDVQLKAFNDAKEQFATLQKTAEKATHEARLHQSERDRATAELNRVRQSVSGDQQGPPRAQTSEDRVFTQLVADGMEPAAAKVQAKTMSKILDAERAQIQQQLGQQFAPVATLALQNQAEGAFNAAMAVDHLGWSAIPEVAELVWQSALDLTKNGQQADAATIKNLAYMHFCSFTEKNPQHFATLQTAPNQPNNGMTQPFARPSVPTSRQTSTGFSYPGAHFAGRVPTAPDPNGARTVLDANTHAALKNVTDMWKSQGYNPKG